MQSLEICIIHFLFYRKFLQLRTSGSLCFHNSDVNTVFDIYKEKSIPAELGLVIGAITESQKLINLATVSKN